MANTQTAQSRIVRPCRAARRGTSFALRADAPESCSETRYGAPTERLSGTNERPSQLCAWTMSGSNDVHQTPQAADGSGSGKGMSMTALGRAERTDPLNGSLQGTNPDAFVEVGARPFTDGRNRRHGDLVPASDETACQRLNVDFDSTDVGRVELAQHQYAQAGTAGA